MQPIKKCKLCKETFTENFNLEIHLKTHNEAETFEKSVVLKWQYSEKEIYKCETCDRQCASNEELTNHGWVLNQI